MDSTVTVYEYEIFDPQQRRWRKAAAMATSAAIDREGGVPMRLSALVVDASRVDDLGYLQPGEHSQDRTGKSRVDAD